MLTHDGQNTINHIINSQIHFQSNIIFAFTPELLIIIEVIVTTKM